MPAKIIHLDLEIIWEDCNTPKHQFSQKSYKDALQLITAALSSGQIIIHPTDTQLGMAVDTTNVKALKSLFAVKQQRQADQPFITACRDLNFAKQLVKFSAPALKLAEKFWPGPLTLVLPAKTDLDNKFLVKDGYRAVRIPGDDCSQFLLQNYPNPLTTTSANISGQRPVQDSDEAMRLFDEQAAVIIDGREQSEIPSTIVRVDNDKIEVLRLGVITEEEISNAI
ncbi:MAG: L-threonylcarbamoyladenylate synthase [Patescibacteria group bacterium]|nr:L-threonylcarbamoyladenylate synthase [Patescibacteria group bacterium]